MATATFIKDVTVHPAEDQKLYRLDPPHVETHWSGVEMSHQYVVVSGVFAMYSGPETYIFPASPDGKITDFSELEGSFRGEIDHDRALQGMGYEVFNGDVVESTIVEEKELES